MRLRLRFLPLVSVEALAIALHHSRADSATTKLVLLGIANHDGDGGAWPSVATLARYACCSPRTVQRAVDELERLREVERIVQAGGTRHTPDHRRPNLYSFLLSCPPDCDRTTAHRTRNRPGPMVELQGLDPVDDPSTRVTPMSPHRVTPMSPEPSTRTTAKRSDPDQPQNARADLWTWTHACQDGTMESHRRSRKTGACAYCAATRIPASIVED